jgi:hypothetical protein
MAKLFFGVVAIATVAVGILFPFAASPADRVKSITVSELNQLQVIGLLGHPLGTIVTIEGVVADDSYRIMRADLGHTLLRVQTVGGKKLLKEQVFHFGNAPAEIEKPKVGSKFKYIGYETGGFTGTPQGTFDYVRPFATTGYYFTTAL